MVSFTGMTTKNMLLACWHERVDSQPAGSHVSLPGMQIPACGGRIAGARRAGAAWQGRMRALGPEARRC